MNIKPMPWIHGDDKLFDYQRRMIDSMAYLQFGLPKKEDKPMKYEPTAKVFRPYHLTESVHILTGFNLGECTTAQYETFDRNFLRPNNYSYTQPISKAKLLRYALTRDKCFIKWLVRNGYYSEVEDVRKIQLSLSEGEFHKLWHVLISSPHVHAEAIAQLGLYIDDPEKKAFEIREESYQYDAVIKLLRHCETVGTWKSRAACIDWIKEKLDAKK